MGWPVPWVAEAECVNETKPPEQEDSKKSVTDLLREDSRRRDLNNILGEMIHVCLKLQKLFQDPSLHISHGDSVNARMKLFQALDDIVDAGKDFNHMFLERN